MSSMKITTNVLFHFFPRSITCLCLAALFVGCTPTPQRPTMAAGPSAADAAFDALARRYFDEVLALSPVNATGLGDHRFDGELDDVSANARAQTVSLEREMLATLHALDRAQLSRTHQVDAQLLASQLDYDIFTIEELQSWAWNPLLYTNLAGNGVYSLLARDFAPLPERLRNVHKRLVQLPRFLAQVRESLELARVPKVYAETAAKQNSGVISLIDELVVPQHAALPAAEQAELRAAIERARNAVSQHQIWLEKKLVPAATGDFRAG